ncbi:MAG: hypothetical protein WKF55_14900 [Gemmatimonadaceae bacterium]
MNYDGRVRIVTFMYHQFNPGVRLLSAALAVAGLAGASAHAMGSSAGWCGREIENGKWMPDVVQSVHVKSVIYGRAMPPQNSDSTRLGHD